jgi:hypothetical protein
MLIDEIAKKNINKKIKKIKRMRTTIEIKTKIRTTLNFGWASAIPEERREIRGGAFNCHQTTSNTCATT